MFTTLLWNIVVLISVSMTIFFVIGISAWATATFNKKFLSANFNSKSIKIGLLAGLPFGLSAIVLGFLSGLSYEPAVSALITGVISLISGAALVIIKKDVDILHSVSIVVVIFAINLLSGATLGTGVRDQAISMSEDEKLNELLSKSTIEFKVNNYRANLGLPPISIIEKPKK